MSLPVPNLDDRTFQDLVDEAKRRIPTHCPEWTNHNLTDPGVALIELFAWMTEQSLYRLNQVPDLYYTHMLNMMGFEPFPPTAARTDVTFWLVDVVQDTVSVPAGTQVATSGQLGTARVFTTLADLMINQPVLLAALVTPTADSYESVFEELRLANKSVEIFQRRPVRPGVNSLETGGDCFYLGFERSLAGNAIRLEIVTDVESGAPVRTSSPQGIGIIPSRPPLRWEVWAGEGWIPCAVYRDSTGGINRDGQVTLLVPPAHEPLALSGHEGRYWLRALTLDPEPGQPAYRTSPQIRRLRVDSIGGSVLAEHSDEAPREVLGRSSGRPDQHVVTRFSPVLPRRDAEVIEIVDGEATETWQEVPDFVDSGPHDAHYMWNSSTGEVRFGPLIRYPASPRAPQGSARQHGRTPPQGSLVVATHYRHGGGFDGNVGPGTLVDLRTSLPYVDRVENVTAAIGGVDAETVENAKRRGPYSLRAGGRAVTSEDFERLAVEADPAIARVRCLPPERTGGPIRLLLVPNVKRTGEQLELDDFALSDDMVARVTAHLDERRILGTAIELSAPYYQGVTVAALVNGRPGRPPEVVERRALDALYSYLNPLSGGPNGTGWPFDTHLNSANVVQLLEAVDGVERVEQVLFFEYDLRNHERRGSAREVVKLGPDSLFLSSNHHVVVR